jgi:hypothetical protein
MKSHFARPTRTFARLRQGLLLLWAGIAIGVAFLATPAKFLAPSLTLPVALDVGRQTFAIYNRAELALLVLLVVIGLGSRAPRRWFLALTVPGAIVVLQAVWLIPLLDQRVGTILAGGAPAQDSNLHAAYIAMELVKIIILASLGFAAPGQAGRGALVRHRRERATGGGNDGYRIPRGWRAMPQDWRGAVPDGPEAANE